MSLAPVPEGEPAVTAAPAADSLTRDKRSLAQTPLRKFFEAAVRYEASDLLLRGGQVPKLRLKKVLKNLDHPPLDVEQFERWVEQSLTPGQWQRLQVEGSIDLGVDLNEEHRFRVNIYRTRGRFAISARRVHSHIGTFEELNLPPILARIAEAQQGLVVVAGVTGSGKSTTLAAMIRYINERRACHIVTIEDPIEYLFPDAKAMVSQREVGIDVPDFATALRALVRENPDVVMIGEMRDKETFEAALRAAETGHLVFVSIHASSAAQAFGRIYDLFPQEERSAIRNLLAFQLHAVIYQKLLPTILEDPPVVPAVEILLQSPPTRKFILDGREHELIEVIKDNRQAGMQTLTDSLVELVNKQLIHPRTAMAAAPTPEEVKMRLRGITSE